MPLGAFRLNGIGRRIIEIVTGRTAVTVTTNGAAQIDTAQSQFGGASALFDGSGDWLNVGTIPDQTNADDFSIEGWVRFNSLPSVWAMFAGASSNSYVGVRNFSGTYALGGAVTGATGTFFKNMIIPTAPTTGVWYHWSMTKTGGNLYHFWNGQLLTTVNNSSGSMSSDKGWNQVNRVGNWFNSTDYSVNGHLDEIRFSNTARYTAGFTPPTAPFVNDDNTLLLLHMDGTDSSTDFIDDNGVRTKNGVSAIGNAQVDTAQSQFGGASALFDGSGDRLSIAHNTQFNYGSNDFTIELWVRANNFTGFPSILAMAAVGTNGGWNLQFSSGGILYIEYGFDGSNPSTRANTTSLSANVWSHVAFVRNGSTVTAYKDGVAGTSHSIGTGVINASTAELIVGDGFGLATTWSEATDFNGHIDEVRISNTARYTANFTPSSTAFTNDANTLLLLHMDGTDGSTTFTDDNS